MSKLINKSCKGIRYIKQLMCYPWYTYLSEHNCMSNVDFAQNGTFRESFFSNASRNHGSINEKRYEL